MMQYAIQVYHKSDNFLYDAEWIMMISLPFSSSLLERLSAIGAITLKGGMLTYEDAEKAVRILRLRRALGVNLSGATIIVELMDRLEKMDV